MPDTILRQWLMLRLVPRAPRKVATSTLEDALADRGFAVDRRSIQRDLVKLSAFFPLVCDGRTKPFGWSWLREADPFDMPGLDLHGALAFRLAEEHLEGLLPPATRAYLEPHFRRARAVLDELEGRPLSTWPAKVRVLPSGLARRPPEIEAAVLEAVETALLEERRLAVRYCRRGEAAVREADVSPLALVHREGVAYLVGTAREYDDVLQFPLHRMVTAEVLPAARRARAGFDIDAYLRSGAFDFPVGPALLALRAVFHPRAAPPLVESPVAPDQVTETCEDGWLLLTGSVPDTNQLRVWLRGFGPLVEVLAPASLREELAAEARALVARYGRGTSKP